MKLFVFRNLLNRKQANALCIAPENYGVQVAALKHRKNKWVCRKTETAEEINQAGTGRDNVLRTLPRLVHDELQR